MPGGTWHRTEAVDDQPAIALSLSFSAMGVGEWLSLAIERDLAVKDPAWRALPAIWQGARPSDLPPEVLAFVRDRVAALQQLLDGSESSTSGLARVYRQVLARGAGPHSGPVPPSAVEPVRPNDELVLADGFVMTHHRGVDGMGRPTLSLFFGELEVAFERSEEQIIGEGLLRESAFIAGSVVTWPGPTGAPALTWEEAALVLDALVEAGVLVRP